MLEVWCKGLIIPVHKRGDVSDPNNYRPICMTEVNSLLIMNLGLNEVLQERKVIHISRIGFKEKQLITSLLLSLSIIPMFTINQKENSLDVVQVL